MQWGQFLDHDVTSTPQTRGFNNSFLKCCTADGHILENDLLHPDCMPIEISTKDLFYSQFNTTCMEFVRSSPAPRRDCTLGQSTYHTTVQLKIVQTKYSAHTRHDILIHIQYTFV